MPWETNYTNKDGLKLTQTVVSVKAECVDLSTNYINLPQNLALAGQLGDRLVDSEQLTEGGPALFNCEVLLPPLPNPI